MDRSDYQLVFPYLSNRVEYGDLISEYDEYNEVPMPISVHYNEKNFEKVIAMTNEEHSAEHSTGLSSPVDTYWLMEKGSERILGAISILQEIGEKDENFIGNITFGIRPTERNKGYSKIMLSLALEKCAEIGMKKVLIICEEDNIATIKTIEANGGVYADQIIDNFDNKLNRYWIEVVDNNEIIIRDATIEDYEVIHKINEESLGYEYPEEDTKKRIVDILNRDENRIFMSDYNGYTVGYIHGEDYAPTYSPPLKNVIALGILPEYQNKGIGTKLLDKMENWAKDNNASGLRLLADETNNSVNKFYARNGYRFIKRQRYYEKYFK